ncbi:MAG: hypothetical protein U9N59_07115 [Campylobacterota bacterium]|nr:hypothetical protein [Campylobacterota bacterium]
MKLKKQPEPTGKAATIYEIDRKTIGIAIIFTYVSFFCLYLLNQYNIEDMQVLKNNIEMLNQPGMTELTILAMREGQTTSSTHIIYSILYFLLPIVIIASISEFLSSRLPIIDSKKLDLVLLCIVCLIAMVFITESMNEIYKNTLSLNQEIITMYEAKTNQ